MMQGAQDAQRFSTRREEYAQQQINAALSDLDAHLQGIVAMRRDYGPSADDAAVLGMFVTHAADAIERHLAMGAA